MFQGGPLTLDGMAVGPLRANERRLWDMGPEPLQGSSVDGDQDCP